jgi:hypothetical protein
MKLAVSPSHADRSRLYDAGPKTQPTAKPLSRNTLAHVVSSNLDQFLTEALVDLLVGRYGSFSGVVYQKPVGREMRHQTN